MPSSITENLKKRIPWFVKIPAKIALSRLPLGISRWQDLNLFRAGAMDDPRYAWDTFTKHLDAIGRTELGGCTVLEIGPGNSLLTALFARSSGAIQTFLVDGARLATQNISIFAQAEQMLSELGRPAPGVSAEPSLEKVLERLNATYLIDGLASLRTIPNGSVDFLFSNAVLEHIRLSEFTDLLQETRRVLKADGVSSHVIDFRDHLQNGLNNLRFSERIWESKFMSRSGFYTNRLPWPAMVKIFQQTGFVVETRSLERWPGGLPTSQKSMASPFKDRAPEDLMIMSAHVVLRCGH